MNDFAVGAGLSAFGNLLGTSLANNTNQENFNRSLAFQKYQYEDSKKYNSAYRQAERLRAAGINPAFALGSMTAGTISAGSSPSANPALPLELPNLGDVFSGLATAETQRKNIAADTEQKEATTKGLNTDNLFRAEDWLSKLRNRNADTRSINMATELTKLNIQYESQAMKNRLLKLDYETQYQDALLTAQDITNQYLPTQLAEGCAEIVARQFANYSTGRASLKQASAAIMQAMNQRHAFDAQFGGNPEDRKKFFNSTLDNLLQLRDTRRSEEFHNLWTPGGFSIKGPLGVGGSSNYNSMRGTEYDNFLNYKKHG